MNFKAFSIAKSEYLSANVNSLGMPWSHVITLIMWTVRVPPCGTTILMVQLLFLLLNPHIPPNNSDSEHPTQLLSNAIGSWDKHPPPKEHCTSALLDAAQDLKRVCHTGIVFELKSILTFTYDLVLK